MSKRTIRTLEKREKFLEALRKTCNVSSAAKSSGLGRTAAYAWRKDDAKFASDWDEAIAEASDLLEEEAMRRAMKGVKRPIVQGGRVITHVTEYSDTLLIFLLKGAKREKYAERKDVKHEGRMTLEQLVCGDD